MQHNAPCNIAHTADRRTISEANFGQHSCAIMRTSCRWSDWRKCVSMRMQREVQEERMGLNGARRLSHARVHDVGGTQAHMWSTWEHAKKGKAADNVYKHIFKTVRRQFKYCNDSGCVEGKGLTRTPTPTLFVIHLLRPWALGSILS